MMRSLILLLLTISIFSCGGEEFENRTPLSADIFTDTLLSDYKNDYEIRVSLFDATSNNCTYLNRDSLPENVLDEPVVLTADGLTKEVTIPTGTYIVYAELYGEVGSGDQSDNKTLQEAGCNVVVKCNSIIEGTYPTSAEYIDKGEKACVIVTLENIE